MGMRHGRARRPSQRDQPHAARLCLPFIPGDSTYNGHPVTLPAELRTRLRVGDPLDDACTSPSSTAARPGSNGPLNRIFSVSCRQSAGPALTTNTCKSYLTRFECARATSRNSAAARRRKD